jgi:hypothetical protein
MIEGTHTMNHEQIAAALTEAQRRAILACDTVFWCDDWRTAEAILRKGLIERLDYKCCGDFTPLGLAVRKLIEESRDA